MAMDERDDPRHGNRDLGTIARLLVPIGMGVFTWLLALLVVGVLLSMDSASLLSVVMLGALGVLFVPVYRFRPWEEDVTERVLGFARRRRRALVVAVGLFVVVRLPVVSELFEPLFGLLLFPLRIVPQVLYDVTVFYGAHVGERAGQLLFDVGRLYAEFLWLYTVGGAVLKLVPGGGE